MQIASAEHVGQLKKLGSKIASSRTAMKAAYTRAQQEVEMLHGLLAGAASSQGLSEPIRGRFRVLANRLLVGYREVFGQKDGVRGNYETWASNARWMRGEVLAGIAPQLKAACKAMPGIGAA
jgi:hypothetical protein